MDRIYFDSADAISEADWSQLDAGGDPFASRGFLGAAERVGASGTALGWRACHLGLRDDRRLLGLLPLYRREHSFGDFSRDWNWEAAWARAGLNYYPKLVSGIPYTPSPGPRLLVHRDADRGMVVANLVAAAVSTTIKTGASSWQCLFVREPDRQVLEAAGALLRRGVQFHWFNRGYGDFDDFLAGFTAAKRKKLKRERRMVGEAGLRLATLHGDTIEAGLWPSIHRQYQSTFHRHGNHPAFPLEFFTQVAKALGRSFVVFAAFAEERLVATAICYRDSEALYGRHWGTDFEQPGLHFELCYHQGIEYCIREGLSRFEPGAQGEHKLARGFEPIATWSSYWIADPGMRRAVAEYFGREDAAMRDYEADTEARLPFRQIEPRPET